MIKSSSGLHNECYAQHAALSLKMVDVFGAGYGRIFRLLPGVSILFLNKKSLKVFPLHSPGKCMKAKEGKILLFVIGKSNGGLAL